VTPAAAPVAPGSGGEPRSRLRLAGAALAGVTAIVLLVWSPWHGAILFSVSLDHGIDVGDLPAILLFVLAVKLAEPVLVAHRRRLGPVASSELALAALAVTLAVIGALEVARVLHRLGPVVAVIGAAAVAGAALWAIVAAVVDRDLWPAAVRSTVAIAAVVLLAGLVVDAAATPSGTLFGCGAASAWLAARARRRAALVVFAAAAAGTLALDVASLADIAGVDVLLSRSQGGAARTVALVAILLAGTSLERWARTDGVRGATRG
jgi:hypothetical protein